jgi:hypothetical protein
MKKCIFMQKENSRFLKGSREIAILYKALNTFLKYLGIEDI